MKTTGNILRQKREELGLTVEKVSEMLGVSQPYTTMVENDTKNPSKKFLENIKKILHLSELDIKAIEEYEEFRRIPEKFQKMLTKKIW